MILVLKLNSYSLKMTCWWIIRTKRFEKVDERNIFSWRIEINSGFFWRKIYMKSRDSKWKHGHDLSLKSTRECLLVFFFHQASEMTDDRPDCCFTCRKFDEYLEYILWSISVKRLTLPVRSFQTLKNSRMSAIRTTYHYGPAVSRLCAKLKLNLLEIFRGIMLTFSFSFISE